MKYVAFILGLLFIAGCATSSTTSSPVHIDGIWGGEYDSGIDGQPPMLFTFNFLRDGESLTGNMNNAAAGPDLWTPLEEGKIKGNTISFTTKPAPTMEFKYKGKVDGNHIKMTFKVKMPGRPGMGKSGRGGGSMMSDEGKGQIRSGRIMSTGMASLPSGKFTITGVK
ncbi:MAG: hypothetical protein JW896_08835 [Deltaproteobacteria bacterium]|nr:hypothetical protein [Deltaproteobacteria bacterium]